jgi:hypothetical protein
MNITIRNYKFTMDFILNLTENVLLKPAGKSGPASTLTGGGGGGQS